MIIKIHRIGKDLGSYHGVELTYVFENFVPQEWAWSSADRAHGDGIAILGEFRDERRSQQAGPSALAAVQSRDRLRAVSP